MLANFVTWDNVYATNTSHEINFADAMRLAHFSTAVHFNMVLKDRLGDFFMLHPLSQQRTYNALKVFMLASDRNMAAITSPAAGIITLPTTAAI